MNHEAVLTPKDLSRRIDEFYGPRKIRVFAGEKPVLDSLLSAIRTDETGGEPFRRNLANLTTFMGKEWQEAVGLERSGYQESIVGIAIPRGGIPIGTGLKQVLFSYSHFETNDGKDRHISEPLLPADFPHQPINHVIIADAVIGSGQTIIRTVEEVSKIARVRFFHVFSTVASSLGIKEILRTHPYGLRICTACVENQFEWVIKDGKPVLFVTGIGDAGELVSKP